jgi:signal transduction histidine kinase
LGVNKRLADAFGFDRTSISGTPLGNRIGAEEDSFCREAQAFFQSTLTQTSFTACLKSKTGEKWHLVEAQKYAGGGEALFIGIDITEQKQMEAMLLAERERRHESTRLAGLGEMAAGIAHEIKTPLSILMANADLAENSIGQPEKLLGHIEKVQKSADRIVRIIRSLQSSLRSGENDPFAKADLFSLLQDGAEFTRDHFRRFSVELKFKKPSFSTLADCRETQIAQVFLNLLRNGAEAVAELPNRWVEVDMIDAGSDLVFRFTDSGPGIPADIRERLVEAFFTTKGKKGTGLGLSISKRILEEHGGSLTIDSTSPNTCFVLRLPKTKAKV